jgi:hypothetical protein
VLKIVRELWAIIWALPWTLFGALIGLLGLVTGGRGRVNGRTLEFWGGGTGWFLRYFPIIRGASAVTFGHAILGQSAAELDACRKHELVHVRQYERWGPLFVPAYLTYWLALSVRGKSGYWDNPFEREAYGEAGCDG